MGLIDCTHGGVLAPLNVAINAIRAGHARVHRNLGTWVHVSHESAIPAADHHHHQDSDMVRILGVLCVRVWSMCRLFLTP